MIKFDPKIHHRRSIRLRGYDYSQSGAYFVTICTHNRELLFESESVENMLRNFWGKIPTRFSMAQLDEFVVMPNHVHGIIMIGQPRGIENVQPRGVAPTTLGNVVDWYKTMTTNAYINGVNSNQWGRFKERFWQRNYFEHVVRDDEDLDRIRQYIIDNPTKWGEDENNPNRQPSRVV
jgi:putative transposase